MYVCICHGITDRQIRETLDRGAASLGELQMQVPIGGCCGRCLSTAEEMVVEHLEKKSKLNCHGNGPALIAC